MLNARNNRFWRHPVLAGLMALVLLLGSVVAYTGFHERQHHAHDSAAAHHSHTEEFDCAICLFHGSASSVDLPAAPVLMPEFVGLVSFRPSTDGPHVSVIAELWSGRAPPSFSVS